LKHNIMLKDLAGRFQEASRDDESLVLEHLSLVRRIAYRLSAQMPRNLEVQDLISAGVVGLIQAVRDFDPSQKTSLKTYASIRIRGAILDAVREQDWVPRSVRERYKKYVATIHKLEERLRRAPEDDEIQKALGLSKESYYEFLEQARPLSFLNIEDLPLSVRRSKLVAGGGESSGKMDPGLSAEFKEVRHLLAGAIEILPEREQRVIQLYYFEELNLKEIGQVLGVGESRVCQLHTQALMRLKGKLKEEGIGK